MVPTNQHSHISIIYTFKQSDILRSFNPGLILEIEAFVPLKHYATETVLHKKDQCVARQTLL